MTTIGTTPPPSTPRPPAAAAYAPRAEGLAPPGEGDGAPQGARLAPNPSLRMDPALNIVVIEFRDASGDIRRSMPTERELASYRAALRRGDEGAPGGGVSPPPAMPNSADGEPARRGSPGPAAAPATALPPPAPSAGGAPTAPQAPAEAIRTTG